jgi:hypothetical protein
MAFRRFRYARLLLLLPGVAVTIGAAAFGFLTLDFFRHPGCRRPKSLTERFRLRAIAEATRQYVAEEGRCPSGTGELVAARYLDRNDTRGAYGGRFALACWTTTGDTFIQVRSAGADETFDTSDDLVVDGDLGTLPPSPLSAP